MVLLVYMPAGASVRAHSTSRHCVQVLPKSKFHFAAVAVAGINGVAPFPSPCVREGTDTGVAGGVSVTGQGLL